jgi:peptide deformylase
MSEIITIDTSNPTTMKVDSGEILSLVPETDPILKTPTVEFSFETEGLEKASKLSRDLIKTISTHKAFGLAANQCGIPYSVICIGYADTYITLFNPKLVSTSNESVMMQEGCLSFPFLVLGLKRSKSITIEYQDFEGVKHTSNLDGISARVFLHELDHLNGITFDTLAKPLALNSGFKKREKYMKRYARNLIAQQRM